MISPIKMASIIQSNTFQAVESSAKANRTGIIIATYKSALNHISCLEEIFKDTKQR